VAQTRHADAVAPCRLLGDQRTWLGGGSKSENDPYATLDDPTDLHLLTQINAAAAGREKVRAIKAPAIGVSSQDVVLPAAFDARVSTLREDAHDSQSHLVPQRQCRHHDQADGAA
jgi:hypothetical protein